jgi:flavin reductase (DIM6/NTAB) family NADH-FMN oxidoreductase RutF
MTPPEAALKNLSSDEFRDVIGHFATGVTVITAVEGDALFGTTASAVASLSLEPPMLIICMNRQSSTGGCVSRVRRFAVNILNEHQGHLAQRFATKAPDKFDGVQLITGRYGEPLLAEALARVECHVVEEVSGGSHTVFLAQVHQASAGVGTPLAYYRGAFGRLVLEASTNSEIHDAVRGLCASELGAAALAVGHAPPDKLTELRALVDATSPRGRRSPEVPYAIGDVLEIDRMFHSRLIALADSKALTAAYERIAASVPLARWFAGGNGPEPDLLADDTRILEAYERGNLPAALEAIRSHYLRADAITADMA